MKDVTENYKKYLPNARSQSRFSRENFSFDIMSKKLCDLVDKGLEGVPTHVGLKLPKLKKVGESNTAKLKLPKLKKVEA